MSHTLYVFPGNPRGQGPQIVADFAHVKLNFVWVSREEAGKAEHVKRHPLGKVPLLETPEGKIFETHAILRHLARKSTGKKHLLGKTLYEQGLVNQWLDFINLELVSLWANIVPFVWGRPTDETGLKTYFEAKSNLITKLRVLEDYLKNHTYLAGHQITVADIQLYEWLSTLFAFTIDENTRRGLTNLTRWFVHIGHYDEVAKFHRKPFLAQNDWFAAQAPKKKPEESKKEGEKKKEDAPKKKEEAPKKKEEAPKKKKEEAAGGNDDEEEAPKPKPKKVYDTLPPTTFNLFDFKTLFVNAPDKKEAMDFFWKNYDPTGFSLWFCKYIKYEGEGVKLFLTSNLMHGTLQRLDEFRKYAFGVQGVYGEEGNYDIRGVWIWRGTEIAPDIKDLPNFEYHTWDKLDEKNPEHRKLVEDFWSGLKNNESVVDGLVAREVTYFK